ncbi:MAG: riboflavin synthase subunit alpha [Candidatus Thermoplasmatota archaeon]|nr:riboflavin synthase subunit alpha [Candidatus Thermoplasmatota archaeon]MEC8258082.1 riboflavin synthase subunit alpha [Candidatus Thermoplasmatota archaeon]MEC8313136.1 riboflavin synthase subunit alpha [Candidatus Thermoplasmatota archaeon]
MFTGIVQGTGEIISTSSQNTVTSFDIRLPDVTNLNIGASVSINGVCLTVVAIESDIIQFDIINETLERTNLGDLIVGDFVNIERSLKFGDEVGGHILSGHIFGTGIISSKTKTGDQMSLSILAPPVMRKYLTEKGYIAIDGISLTVGKVDSGLFDLHIIPETMRLTTLESKNVGDVVNIEIDSNTQLIVETIERLLAERSVE